MKTRRLIVTKPHKYGTRHLTAGEEYEVPPRHAVALVASKRAKFAPDKPAARAVKTAEAKSAQIEETTAPTATTTTVETVEHKSIYRLQAEAMRLGIEVDHRWGVARLQHEIAQAKR